MIYHIRLFLYFTIGVLLSAWTIFAHAQVTTNLVWNGWNGPNVQAFSSTGQLLGTINPYNPLLGLPSAGSSSLGQPTVPSVPVAANAGAGKVSLTSNVSLSSGSGAGARVPVATAVKSVATVTPLAIAKSIVKWTPTGLLVGTVAGAVAPLLLQAGVNYYNNTWNSVTPAGLNTGVWLQYQTSEPKSSAYAACTPNGVQGVDFSYTAWGYDVASGRCWHSNLPYIQWTLTGSPVTHTQGCVADDPRPDCTPSLTPIPPDTAANAIAAALPTYPNPAQIVQNWPANAPPDTSAGPLPQVATGPASVTSPGVASTQTVPANGTEPAKTIITTTTTTANNTYNNNTTNNTSTVVTNIVNNTTTTTNGVPSGTTSTPGIPDPSQNDNPVVNDTPLDDIPKLYERKYPDGFKGVWDARSAEMKATPLFGLSAVFTPNIDGGSCPSWSMSANIGPNMNYGGGTISPPCWIWTMIKAVVVISALLLARSLIFGG